MNLSYKYEIKLSKVQREALEKVFHTCRFLYN
ncbi:helix-turn-helix domain-containing protein, partial [Pseudomonas syringae]